MIPYFRQIGKMMIAACVLATCFVVWAASGYFVYDTEYRIPSEQFKHRINNQTDLTFCVIGGAVIFIMYLCGMRSIRKRDWQTRRDQEQ